MKKQKRRILSGILSVVLVLIMVIGIAPTSVFNVSAADASHTVDAETAASRTNALVNSLNGKHFTTTQASCGNSDCDYCKNMYVIKAAWLKNTMGLVPDSVDLMPGHYEDSTGYIYPSASSCAGFANYCLWYIYAQNSSDNVRMTNIYTGKYTKSDLDNSGVRTGDVIRIDSHHSVVYISHDSSGMTVLDNNWTSSDHNRIEKHTIGWSWRSGTTMAITRGKNWSSQSTSHTHSYTDSVVAPTCTSRGYTKHTCSSCGDTYNDNYVNALGHNEGSWTTTVAAKCTTAGTEKIFCTRCGETLNSRSISALGHSEGNWTVTLEPKCLEEGTEKIFCTRCGDTLNSRQIDALGHDYASEVVTEATCKGKGQMKYVCKRCEFTCYDIIEPKGHNHEEAIWTTTVAPTCTADGEQTAYCPDCTELIDTRTVEALGHDEGTWVVTAKPTCTAKGEETRYCTRCGKATDKRSIDALGHDEGTWIVTSQPTCTAKGEETCYCTRCGKATDKRSIDALGHDEGTWIVTSQPTCTAKGEETCFCTRCGKATDKRSIDVLGHNDGVWKVDFEATADHDGQMSRYCTSCNEALESKTFKLHKHSEGYRETVIEATCTNNGEGGIFCATCGVKFGTYTIPSLGHDYNDWYTNSNGTHSRTCSRCHNFESANCDYDVTVKEATCTEDGYTTHVCKICGYKYVDGHIDALGHSWSEWIDTEDGTAHTRTCSECELTETKEHIWGDWVLNDDAKIFKHGTKTHTCEVCGKSESEKAIHTAWIVRIPYTIVLWAGNLIKKLVYVVSFQWFLPDHSITPTH